MAAASKQYGKKKGPLIRVNVNELSIYFLKSKISKLNFVMRSLALGNMQQVKDCDICATLRHPMDTCPTL